MNIKYYILALSGLSVYGITVAQEAVDAYRFSQPDLKGTARFMSMGGAFGALGGDLSSLSQNPAGIGVYRSNEVGFTLDLDLQNSSSDAQGVSTKSDQTKFLLNNIGGVATLKLASRTFPNFNIGFTYNKGTSFNRKYAGSIPHLYTSMSNYIAGIANECNLNYANIEEYGNYDPYDSNVPWLPILAYNALLINGDDDETNTHWSGLYNSNTTGSGYFNVLERGSVDEYNIALGGNIANKLFWGMNFDIVNIDYRLNALWGENLEGAYAENPDTGDINQVPLQWNMQNLYRCNGTGFNYQLGFIYKPIQELRIGFAFHTPTFYNLTETYSADASTSVYGNMYNTSTNYGYPGVNYMNFQSPWKIIVSAAGVIGSKFIISADYEWTGYKTMKFSDPTYNDGYWDYDWDWYGNPTPMNPDYYGPTNQSIKNTYQNTNTLRLGAEYRVTPNFSVRAGYSFVSSPVQQKAKEGTTIYTAGTIPNYRFDNTTNYATCGIGYRTGGFYMDLAYVYKHMDSEYHAFTPDPMTPDIPSPAAKLSFNNSQIILSCGYKF